MNDQTPAPIGHNMPPEEIDPREAAVADFAAYIEEAQNWADGVPVETDDQLAAVEALQKNLKLCIKGVDKAREADVKPFHDAWKGRIAFWKPTQDDLDRLVKALTKVMEPIKLRKHQEQQEREAKARREAAEARRAAEEAARLAEQRGSIDDLRAADAAKREAMEAKKGVSEVKQDKIKGLRTVWKWCFVGDGDAGRKAALNWIARNDRDAMTAFIEEYVAKNFRAKAIDGVKVWDEKEVA